MTKVLVCGLCPLPFENTLRSFGPGIRTWQFAKSLAEAGHQVHLLAMKIPSGYEGEEALPTESHSGVDIERIEDNEFFDATQIAARIETLQPDVLVGATIYGSNVLALTRPEQPFWADQFGHVMAEAQAKAMLEGKNWPIEHFWKLLEPVLRRADKISGVSRRQRYATIGELGVLGRLGSETCGYEFTSVIPCALTPQREEPVRPVLRGSDLPADAFVVLWSGGYNVWSDTKTLFRALEQAMTKDNRIHLVSTGGAIDGHDEVTYRRFQDRIAGSRFRDRFHLQGWVRSELIPSIQAEANLGVLTEVQIYEGRLGSKNRIVQWMGAGLPVAYNRMGDLGSLLTQKQLGLTFEIGDAEALAEQILWAAKNPKPLAEIARRALQFAVNELSFEATTRDLVAWVGQPSRAPDAASTEPLTSLQLESAVPLPAAGTLSRDRVVAIIVHHRGKEMLGRCLESLLASSMIDLEIIVVENHCLEELPNIANTSARIHTIQSEESLGFSAANNLGVSWAKKNLDAPHFYYFVNNDTESTPDALAHMVNVLEKHPENAMAGPTLLILGADDHYNSLGINVTEDGWGWDEAIGQKVSDYGSPPPQHPVLTVTGSALLIDAPVFNKIGGWTEVYEYYFEDIDLGIKVWKIGRQVIHVPQAVVRHQISATMTDGSARKDFLFWRNRLYLAAIHWPLGLLLRTFWRAWREILDHRRINRPVLRRAMLETLLNLPRLLANRWSFRGKTGWRRFLRSPGSVPPIELPQPNGQSHDPRTLELQQLPALIGDQQLTASAAQQDSSAANRSPAPQGTGGEFELLKQTLTETRAELATSHARAERLGESYAEAMQVLDEIHSSRMWTLWKRFVAARRWLVKPLGFLRRS